MEPRKFRVWMVGESELEDHMNGPVPGYELLMIVPTLDEFAVIWRLLPAPFKDDEPR